MKIVGLLEKNTSTEVSLISGKHISITTMFTTYLLASFLLMNLVSSSMAFRRSLNVSDDPFMDSYIRTIVSMDQQSISLIPRMSDEEFLEFLVDDSRVNLSKFQLNLTNHERKGIFSL